MTAGYLAVWGDLPYGRKDNDSSDERDDDNKRIWDVKAGMSSILTTTPSDPLTTKTVIFKYFSLDYPYSLKPQYSFVRWKHCCYSKILNHFNTDTYSMKVY